MYFLLELNWFRSLREIFFSLDKSIAYVIRDVYNFMVKFTGFSVFEGDQIELLMRNIYAFIGIFMLFRLAFSAIVYLTNPAGAINEKDPSFQGKLPGKIIIVLVLLVMLPFIFTYSKRLEQAIIQDGLIEQIIPTFVDGTDTTGTFNPEGTESYYMQCNYEAIDPDKTLYWDALTYSTERDFVDNNLDARFLATFTKNNGELKSGKLDLVGGDLNAPVDLQKECCKYLRIPQLVAALNPANIFLKEDLIMAECTDGALSNFKLLEGDSGAVTISYVHTTGSRFAMNVLTTFVTPNSGLTKTPEVEAKFLEFKLYRETGNFEAMTELIDDKYKSKVFYIDYRILISTVVMIVVLLLLITTLVDLALRMVKLGFLEIIAPIALITHIESGEKKVTAWDRWIKVYLSTFMDIFIKIAVIDFGVWFMGFALGKLEEQDFIWRLMIIIGALMFMKSATQIISSITGMEISSTLTPNPFKKAQEIPVLGTAVAATGGAIGGAVTGAIKGGGVGAAMGALQGGAAGAKSVPMGGTTDQSKYGGAGMFGSGSKAVRATSSSRDMESAVGDKGIISGSIAKQQWIADRKKGARAMEKAKAGQFTVGGTNPQMAGRFVERNKSIFENEIANNQNDIDAQNYQAENGWAQYYDQNIQNYNANNNSEAELTEWKQKSENAKKAMETHAKRYAQNGASDSARKAYENYKQVPKGDWDKYN